MTTADIMLAQPGNPESFRDHEYDARTISWALLAAILIHLVVAFLLAAFSGVFSPSVPFEEKPAELTFVDLSPASASKNSAFIETDESKKAPEPKDKTFESNANSIGASELAAVALPLFPTSADLSQNPVMADPSHPVTATAFHQPRRARLLQLNWRWIRRFSPSARGPFSIRPFL